MKKTAIITGGASGIGFAIAEKFVQDGISTVIIGRDREKLRQAETRLGELCHPVAFDLNELEKIPGLMQDLHRQFGPPDILVNNAGINLKKDLTEVSNEDFDRILRTNVLAVFALSREAAVYMLPRKKGCILNISSMAAHYGIPKVIAYTASKGAIESMTRAMAVELSPHGIRVNAIAPGFIATDMSAKALDSDPQRKQKVLSRTPAGYLGEPADIGACALFLASDAAGYITGAVVPVDGGNSIGF